MIAGPDHPLVVEARPDRDEPRPLIRVRGRLDALLSRSVFYELVEMAVESDGKLVVCSNGMDFVLGDIE